MWFGELLFHKTQGRKNHGTDWRKGLASTCLGVWRGDETEGFNLHCATVVYYGLLTRMQPSERSPKWRPVLAKGVQRTTSAVYLPSTLSTKRAKSCHISVFLMQFGSVDKASSILFAVFSDCTLGSALFAFAAFIAISDERFSSGLLPSLDGC
jgi:hypothetical protein